MPFSSQELVLQLSLRRSSPSLVSILAAFWLLPTGPAAIGQTLFTNAISLNGTNQHITVPAGVWFSNAFTVEAWVNPRTQAGWGRLIEFGNGPGNNNLIVGLSQATTGKPVFQWYNGAIVTGNLLSPVTLPLNTWSHLACTYDGTNAAILLNGITVTNGAFAKPVAISRTLNYVGRSLYASDAYANATIDDLRIWNTARTQAQIRSGMASPLGASPAGLVLNYGFDEGSGTLVNNSAAGGALNNGTLVNSPARVASTIPTLPIVRSIVATDPTGYTATLLTAINPGNLPTAFQVLYGTTTNYEFATPFTPIPASHLAASNTTILPDLLPVTDYHFCLLATNSLGTTLTPDQLFTSPMALPAITALPATAISPTSSTLNAILNPGGGYVDWFFQYGPGTNYDSTTPLTTLPPGASSPVQAGVTGLQPGTLYHYRLSASNGAGASLGDDLTFTTPAAPPTAATLESGPATTTSTTLRGMVDPGGAGTTWFFEYGLTTAYGMTTPPGSLQAGNVPAAVIQTVTSLQEGTSYHCRLVAFNMAGTNVGADEVATTLGSLHTVTSTNDSGYGSLREAIAHTLPSGTVRISSGLSGQTITLLKGQITVTNSLTIDTSSLSQRLRISAERSSRFFLVTSNASLAISGLTLINGSSRGEPGGAIYNGPGATFTAVNCEISTNLNLGADLARDGNGIAYPKQAGSPASGGSIYNAGIMTLRDTSLLGNAVYGGNGSHNFSAMAGPPGGPASGGAIQNSGTLTLERCTLAGNTATGGAGGMGDGQLGPGGDAFGAAIYNNGRLILLQSTLCGNNGSWGYPMAGARGGAIYNGGLLQADQTTITGNSAAGSPSEGGGIFASAGATNTLHNSLIAGNLSGTKPDLAGVYQSRGNNFVGLLTLPDNLLNRAPSDLVGTPCTPLDPQLGPLTNNGGPTLTISPLPTSPVINAGDDSIPDLSDQRGAGFQRRIGSRIDIGALEFDAVVAGFLPPTVILQSVSAASIDPATGLGTLSLSAAINPNQLSARVWIESGLRTAYGIATAPVEVGDGTNLVPLTLPLSSLAPGHLWHFRVASSSAAGVSYCPDQSVSVGAPGDVNGDGRVSRTEFESVYSAYLRENPLWSMTNAYNLGSGSVDFSLGNLNAGLCSVQYSTNLVDWLPLGPAIPHFSFTDPNAPSSPRRFYRLSFP